MQIYINNMLIYSVSNFQNFIDKIYTANNAL